MGNNFLQGWRQGHGLLGSPVVVCVDIRTLQSCSVDDKSSKLTLERQLVQANSCSVADVAITTLRGSPWVWFSIGAGRAGSRETILME